MLGSRIPENDPEIPESPTLLDSASDEGEGQKMFS